MTKLYKSLLLATALALLAACSDNTVTAATTTPTTPPPLPPAGIALGTSTNSIPTDNSTSATLTATLVDTSNAVMAGVAVSFAASNGNLNASTATTDASGQAIVFLKSGLANFTNRIATVTATVGAQTASQPILITGSTLALTMTGSNNNIQVGAGTLTAYATAKDAIPQGKTNQTIRFSIGATSSGAGTLSAASLTTDVTGNTALITFTPTVAGTVVLTAEWLDSAGAVTATAIQNINVTAVGGTQFAITIPATNPIALSSGATQALAVTVPATIAGTAVTSVRLSATAGTMTGTNPAAPAATSIQQTPSGGAVAATYTAPASAGSVTVQVDALGTVGGVAFSTLSSLSRTFLISAPSTAATKLFLSPAVSTIIPSSSSFLSTTTLEVTVRDVNNNAVGGAAVMFGLLGTTGSGESVSPAVVISDNTGRASTTFTAGTQPTLAAIYAQASIVGQTCTFVPPSTGVPGTAETNPKCDSAPMMVSSSAVSVTVGFGTTIIDTANATQYQLPGSVLVVNSNGSAVAGAPVTLSVFPIAYRNGVVYSGKVWNGSSWLWECIGPFNTIGKTWDPVNNMWVYSGVATDFTASEDANRNGILDSGEDTPLAQTPPQLLAQAISQNGLLSPPQAAGGVVPLTVITDSNGAATFFLQYPKSSARFIKDEVTARVIVLGTESASKMNLELPMSMADDLAATCPIGHEASY